MTLSSGYTGLVSSGQVSVLNSGVSSSIMQNIPVRNSIVHTPPPPIPENSNTNNLNATGNSKLTIF